jgi:hypothetical protein
MNKTAKLYGDLIKELENKKKYSPQNYVHRKYTCESGAIGIIYSVSVGQRTRAFSVPIQGESKNLRFPLWKGIKIQLVTMPEYSDDEQKYIQLEQTPDSDAKIFEVVVEDIRECLEKLTSIGQTATEVYSVLKKWKNFFKSGRKPILSSMEEQGLIGELLFLRYLLKSFGENAVTFWSGPQKTEHDFYIGKNAVEVKTTVTQKPYRAHINNLAQLDDSQVSGSLFLKLYAFRKGGAGSIILPQIINNIRKILNHQQNLLDIFNEKLKEAGYFDSAEDYYTDEFTIRDEYSYEVKDGFPRLIKGDIPKGVYDVEYSISSDLCSNFALDAVTFSGLIKG